MHACRSTLEDPTVAGGFDGSWSLQVSTTRNQSFGAVSSSVVSNAGSAGTRYRFQVWVRSATGTGRVHLDVDEMQVAVRVGGATTNEVTLSPTWQMLALEYTTTLSGTSLDFTVIDAPHGSNAPFLIDNISVRVSLGTTGVADDGSGIDSAPPLVAFLTPSPLVSSSRLAFRTTVPGPLQVALYDLSGRRVRKLLDDPVSAAGAHQLAVDARDDRGAALDPGMYFYEIRAVEGRRSGKLVIAR